MNIEDRHRFLDELYTRCVGDAAPMPAVCLSCGYVRDDTPGCLCGDENWVPLIVAVTELELILSTTRGLVQPATLPRIPRTDA